jgi:hypothetical protein
MTDQEAQDLLTVVVAKEANALVVLVLSIEIIQKIVLADLKETVMAIAVAVNAEALVQDQVATIDQEAQDLMVVAKEANVLVVLVLLIEIIQMIVHVVLKETVITVQKEEVQKAKAVQYLSAVNVFMANQQSVLTTRKLIQEKQFFQAKAMAKPLIIVQLT